MAQDSLPRNAFTGFETIFLPNGLKLWYKRLPGDPNVSVSVSVRVGMDADPPGREELAHFTEHMLFSDQGGRTEQQIKKEVEDRGGTYNGITTWDHTYYFVRLGRTHGIFAIGWLSRLLAPHAMDPAVVEKQREPVALEVGAKPREFFNYVWSWFLNPVPLRVPGFWEREFGIATRWSRDVDLWRSLHRIQSEDLRGFYETWYVPSRMTLTVIGDLDRDSVLKAVTAGFGGLLARTAPPDTAVLRDPGRRRAEYAWLFSSQVSYANRYKFYDLTPREHIVLLFLTRWLDQRLNDRLRFGPRKAVYGFGVEAQRRGTATLFWLNGGIKPAELDYARDVIADEIEALRAGTRADSAYAADRASVARKLRVLDATSKELGLWVFNAFYDERVTRDFPDLVTTFETMPKQEVEAFVRKRMTPGHQVLFVGYQAPLSQGVVAILVIALVWIAIRLARRMLIRPLDMTKLRYVARLQLSLIYKVVVLPLLIAVVAVLLRLLVFGCELLVDQVIVTFDNFWVQWLSFGVLAVIVIDAAIAVFGFMPRKLLCFEDGLVIKYLAYRSRRFAPGDIAELAERRFTEVWLSSRLWGCVPLTFGLRAPGIYLRSRSGRSYFFHVRDPRECLAQIRKTVSGLSV